MLDDIRSEYIEYANLYCVKNWKKISSDELASSYLNSSEPLRSGFLAAITAKFWNKISSAYFRSRPAASEEDCYGWYIDSIVMALDDHVWTNKDSSLYGDKDALEKAINTILSSTRANFFQALQYDKRAVMLNSCSIEELQDLCGDAFENQLMLSQFDDEVFSINEYIKELFHNKDYFSAFMLDGILNCDCIPEDEFRVIRLQKHLYSIDDDYCRLFADTYECTYDEVLRAVEKIKCIKSDVLRKMVSGRFMILRDIIRGKLH